MTSWKSAHTGKTEGKLVWKTFLLVVNVVGRKRGVYTDIGTREIVIMTSLHSYQKINITMNRIGDFYGFKKHLLVLIHGLYKT